MKKNVVKQLAVTGLAVVAVAGVALAAAAAANSSPDSPAAAQAGGPDPSTPAPPTTDLATPVPPATDLATPAPPATGLATPTPPGTEPATPAPSTVRQGTSTLPLGVPARPREKPLPKDAVKACQELLGTQEQQLRPAKVTARLDAEPGTVLVLADSNHWAACNTAYARHNGQGSLRQPAKISTPAATAETFAVANNLIPMKGKEYDFYWAAGRLPSGVAKIAYKFPDGTTTQAVVQGDYWLMQHRATKPYAAVANRAKIKVTLQRANGSVLKEFHLIWGDETCSQISHGC
ncbi:hypothetical protein [Kribbella sp. CA-294648]|uniref:hypothetical protein n=1 Tax=Kribbella sp. CA-294648 TaxID=3239948 RepID=UPI003D94C03E